MFHSLFFRTNILLTLLIFVLSIEIQGMGLQCQSQEGGTIGPSSSIAAKDSILGLEVPKPKVVIVADTSCCLPSFFAHISFSETSLEEVAGSLNLCSKSRVSKMTP